MRSCKGGLDLKITRMHAKKRLGEEVAKASYIYTPIEYTVPWFPLFVQTVSLILARLLFKDQERSAWPPVYILRDRYTYNLMSGNLRHASEIIRSEAEIGSRRYSSIFLHTYSEPEAVGGGNAAYLYMHSFRSLLCFIRIVVVGMSEHVSIYK